MTYFSFAMLVQGWKDIAPQEFVMLTDGDKFARMVPILGADYREQAIDYYAEINGLHYSAPKLAAKVLRFNLPRPMSRFDMDCSVGTTHSILLCSTYKIESLHFHRKIYCYSCVCA